MKKKGFSDEGGERGVDGWVCQRQTHMLEEARVQTVSHAPACEFQRRTGDRRMWACGKLFFGEASARR